jgi:hypothetical protein
VKSLLIKRVNGPGLWLLPLVAILLFGNCNGGVNHFLYSLESRGRLARLDSLVREQQRQRVLTRQHLRGTTRQDQLFQLEQRTNEQAQTLFQSDWQRKKWVNRRNKIERRLRQNPAPKRPLLLPH